MCSCVLFLFINFLSERRIVCIALSWHSWYVSFVDLEHRENFFVERIAGDECLNYFWCISSLFLFAEAFSSTSTEVIIVDGFHVCRSMQADGKRVFEAQLQRKTGNTPNTSMSDDFLCTCWLRNCYIWPAFIALTLFRSSIDRNDRDWQQIPAGRSPILRHIRKNPRFLQGRAWRE